MAAVEHFLNFLDFYSTFKAARPVFGGGGRTFSQFFEFFVLLSRPRAPFLVAAVEYFPNFLDFCSTFKAARPVFGGGGRTFSQFFGFLFYFQGRAPRFWWRR